LKNRKNDHISAMDCLICMKFGMITHIDTMNLTGSDFELLKITMADGRHLEKSKKAISKQ